MMSLMIDVPESQAIRIVDLARQIDKRNTDILKDIVQTRPIWDGVRDEDVLACTIQNYLKDLESLLRTSLKELENSDEE